MKTLLSISENIFKLGTPEGVKFVFKTSGVETSEEQFLAEGGGHSGYRAFGGLLYWFNQPSLPQTYRVWADPEPYEQTIDDPSGFFLFHGGLEDCQSFINSRPLDDEGNHFAFVNGMYLRLSLERDDEYDPPASTTENPKFSSRFTCNGESIKVNEGEWTFEGTWNDPAFTLYHHSGDDEDGSYSIIKSDGDPQWTWYYVLCKLPCVKEGVARYIIGKGCDYSSYYQLWEVIDPQATVEVPRPINIGEGVWKSNIFRQDGYGFPSPYSNDGNFSFSEKDITEHCEILTVLPPKKYKSKERLVVRHKAYNRIDILSPN